MNSKDRTLIREQITHMQDSKKIFEALHNNLVDRSILVKDNIEITKESEDVGVFLDSFNKLIQEAEDLL